METTISFGIQGFGISCNRMKCHKRKEDGSVSLSLRKNQEKSRNSIRSFPIP